MRWIVLALALGAAIMSLIHGVFEILSPSGSMAGLPLEAPGGAFTGLTVFLLGVSAVFALIGGVVAFNRRRVGGIFLIVGALICFFAHPNVRHYGVIYFLGGITSFFLRRNFEDEDYDEDEIDDDEYEEDDDEYENDDEEGDPEDDRENYARSRPTREKKRKSSRSFSFGMKSRAATIKNKRKHVQDSENLAKLNESLKSRSSKVCPVCGASVDIAHKFCFNCGTPLHARSLEPESAPSYDRPPSPMIMSVEEENQQENAPVFKDFQPIFPSEAPPRAAARQESDWDDRQEEEAEEEEQEEEIVGEIIEEEKEMDVEKDVGARRHQEHKTSFSSSNRVFVKPTEDDQPIVKRPLIINPDRSYREFSNYTRRRKRRRRSLGRRIAGFAILALAVGGSAWFLLGMQRGPNPEAEAPPPILNPIPTPAPQPYPNEPEGPSLPAVQIASPTRGVVMGTNVNVRPNHSVSGAVVTKLNSDTRVEVLGSWEGTSGSLDKNWYHIRAGGREGWIYGQYLQPLDGRESTLPEGYTASLLKSFGASKEDLTRELGQPTRQTPTTSTWTGLTANFRGDTEITRIQLTNARHVLLNGAAVGMTDEALYKNVGYPSDYKSGQLRYIERGNQGMSVRMLNGKIQGITVGNI
ncbi:MAG: SH3 domain-containing protein [Synergistaceae bacterium]|jgi:hypothetical protein|nr:SH3 domain-containing protein [Synergistaceae bacterium]